MQRFENVPSGFLSHVRSLLKTLWKPFIRFPVMLLTETDFLEIAEKETQYSSGQTGHSSGFPDCLVYHARPILKISWKSVHTFFSNVVHKQTDRQTNKQTNKQRWKHNLHRSAEVTSLRKAISIKSIYFSSRNIFYSYDVSDPNVLANPNIRSMTRTLELCTHYSNICIAYIQVT